MVKSEAGVDKFTKLGTERMRQMIQIEMTREEAEMLLEILESYLSDLRMEIADTDQMDFREG